MDTITIDDTYRLYRVYKDPTMYSIAVSETGEQHAVLFDADKNEWIPIDETRCKALYQAHCDKVIDTQSTSAAQRIAALEHDVMQLKQGMVNIDESASRGVMLSKATAAKLEQLLKEHGM